MDCHVFRRFCDELVPLLQGARVEKIHQPVPELTMFTLYGGGCKRFLFLRSSRHNPALFLAKHKLSVGSEPPASVMRLRKYLSGQRFVACQVRWLERRLLFRTPYGVGTDGAAVWLDLNLREGPRLLFTHPSNTDSAETEPENIDWPNSQELQVFLADDSWRERPVLSPLLRRTLPLLEDDGERAALLEDLRCGGGDLFVYGCSLQKKTEKKQENQISSIEISAWPLPTALRRGRTEQIFSSSIDAMEMFGDVAVLNDLGHKAAQAAVKPLRDEAKRLGRLLHKIRKERERLQDMAAGKKIALALQAELYRFQSDEKRHTVLLHAFPDEEIQLNPRLTVRENMAFLFHHAARGVRGLMMTEKRLQLLEEEQQSLLARAEHNAQGTTLVGQKSITPLSKNTKNSKAIQQDLSLPKNVQAFRSADGFLLLRGRDAKGNLTALKLASAQDLWLHAAAVTGAHVIVRRDHAAQDVPQQTLEQAGILAALKSERRDEAHSEIWCAQVRYIKPLRSARGSGNVRIDKMESTFTVKLDHTLEERLLV